MGLFRFAVDISIMNVFRFGKKKKEKIPKKYQFDLTIVGYKLAWDKEDRPSNIHGSIIVFPNPSQWNPLFKRRGEFVISKLGPTFVLLRFITLTSVGTRATHVNVFFLPFKLKKKKKNFLLFSYIHIIYMGKT